MGIWNNFKACWSFKQWRCNNFRINWWEK